LEHEAAASADRHIGRLPAGVAWRRAAASAAKDPANKWLARMTVRRLAAEQIRDAALAVTGEIDGRMEAKQPSGASGRRGRSI